jgi:hypothetical protein
LDLRKKISLLSVGARFVAVPDRGRDGHCWPPPAQIRTCGIPAYGSYLG